MKNKSTVHGVLKSCTSLWSAVSNNDPEAMSAGERKPSVDLRRSVAMKFHDWRTQKLEHIVQHLPQLSSEEDEDGDEAAKRKRYDDISHGSRSELSKMLATATSLRAVFTPGSGALAVWRGVVLLTSLVYVVYVPMLMAFPELKVTAAAASMDDAELLLETVLVADVLVHFLTATQWRGLLVRDLRFVAKSYLTSWFAVDFVAALPLGFAGNKLVRLASLLQAVRTPFDSLNPGLVLLAKLLGACVLAWHWVACCFWTIARSGAGTVDAAHADGQWIPNLHETLDAQDCEWHASLRTSHNRSHCHTFTADLR